MRFNGFDDEWIEEKLGNLVQIKSGECTKNLITGIDNSIPYFKVEQLNNSLKYQIKTPYFINDKSKIVNKGSIIFPKRGAAILLNKIRILNQDSFMDTNLMTLTPNNKLYNEFLYYFIYKENLSKIADTTSIPQLNNKHIKPYPIKLPSFEEQLKISKFISSVDKKVALLSQNLEIFNDFKKGLLQQIFTQKLRFKDTENNLYPNWEFLHLKDIITLNGGYAFKSELFKDEGIPIIRISNISQDNSVVANDLVYYDKLKNDHKFIIKKGELIIAMSGATTGKVAVYDFEQISYINQRVGLFKQISNKLYYPFLIQYSLSNSFKKELQKTLVAGAQPNISKKEIEEFKIDLPYYEEQKKIADLLHNIDLKINSIKKQTFEISEFKKGLLQQMFVVRINWRCNFKLAKSPSFNKHLLILKNKIIFIIIK